MTLTDEQLDAGAKYLPLHMGCTCRWDEHGNPPPDCRCEERARDWARRKVREIVEATLDA